MAIELKEVVAVDAPLERVWELLISPRRFVPCMPGAEIGEIIDEKNFTGTVSMRVGAIAAKYSGRVAYESIDPVGRIVVMNVQATDSSGGTVRGKINAELKKLGETKTEVIVASSFGLTGRLVQMGRGLINGVARQLIAIFVGNVRKELEAANLADVDVNKTLVMDAGAGSSRRSNEINLLEVLWRTFLDALRRLFGRSSGQL